jgi:hypothetical protein
MKTRFFVARLKSRDARDTTSFRRCPQVIQRRDCIYGTVLVSLSIKKVVVRDDLNSCEPVPIEAGRDRIKLIPRSVNVRV